MYYIMLIKHHNISVKELNDYVEINIVNDHINFSSFIKDGGFQEYRDLVSKYTNKYCYWKRSEFPQYARNQFYKEVVNLVKKYDNQKY